MFNPCQNFVKIHFGQHFRKKKLISVQNLQNLEQNATKFHGKGRAQFMFTSIWFHHLPPYFCPMPKTILSSFIFDIQYGHWEMSSRPCKYWQRICFWLNDGLGINTVHPKKKACGYCCCFLLWLDALSFPPYPSELFHWHLPIQLFKWQWINTGECEQSFTRIHYNHNRSQQNENVCIIYGYTSHTVVNWHMLNKTVHTSYCFSWNVIFTQSKVSRPHQPAVDI